MKKYVIFYIKYLCLLLIVKLFSLITGTLEELSFPTMIIGAPIGIAVYEIIKHISHAVKGKQGSNDNK